MENKQYRIINRRMSPMAIPGIARTRTLFTPKIMFDVIEQVLEISTEELRSNSRKRELVEARHIFCYFTKENTKFTLSKIGGLVNRDHASILHAVNLINNLLESNKDFNTNKDFKVKFDDVKVALEKKIGHVEFIFGEETVGNKKDMN